MLGVLAIALPLAVDTLPSVSLGEAIARAARLDPAYVGALGQVDNAAWARRAARLAFIVPSLEVGVDAANSRNASVERVINAALCRHDGLGHAIADGYLRHMQPGLDLLHDLDRARRAGHDAGAQR